MDLLATVRKEGSRGGRGEFKWSDVQGSSHRENYLGHSLMAPVGRWQKGRDLSWYSKAEPGAEDEDAAEKAAREKKEELRRIKEAEQDAMARALGLPVPDRSNANLQEMSNSRNFDQKVKDAIDGGAEEGRKGIGFDNALPGDKNSQVLGERIEGNAEAQDRELQYALREYKRRHGEHERRRRSRSRDRERRRHRRDRSREHRADSRYDKRQNESSRTKERHHRRPLRSRSRSRSRDRRESDWDRRRQRSTSPYRREDKAERRRRDD